MRRDYAKKSTRRKRRKKNTRRKKGFMSKFFAGVMIVVILGAFISFLVYLKTSSQVEPPEQKVTTIKTEPKSRLEPVKEKPKKAAEQKPEKKQTKKQPAKQETERQYDYHRLLEQRQVHIPEEELVQPKPREDEYVMQCGSFRQLKAADQMKARMALLGLESDIKSSKNKSGTTWYRVVLGPYVSKRSAERHRHVLQRNGINGCRIW